MLTVRAGYDLPLLVKPIHPEKIVEHIRMRLAYAVSESHGAALCA